MKIIHPLMKMALPVVFACACLLPAAAHAGHGHNDNGNHYGNGNGNGGGGSVPINSGLILLGVAGISYAGFKMYTKYRKTSAKA